MRQIDVIAGIYGGDSLLKRAQPTLNFGDGAVVADNNALEAQIAAQDVIQGFLACAAFLPVELVVARHHDAASGGADDGFVRQEYLFDKLFFSCVSAAAIAREVLGAGGNPFLQVAVLQALDEGGAHCGRQITVLAV